jgi:putative membrane protein
VWNPRWRQDGQEPDYRFTLANERTFLAWIRTALALLAGGVVLEQFALRLAPRPVLAGVAAALAGLSALMSIAAYRHWRDNEIAMRHGRPLGSTLATPLLALASLVVALVIGVLLLWH